MWTYRYRLRTKLSNRFKFWYELILMLIILVPLFLFKFDIFFLAAILLLGYILPRWANLASMSEILVLIECRTSMHNTAWRWKTIVENKYQGGSEKEFCFKIQIHEPKPKRWIIFCSNFKAGKFIFWPQKIEPKVWNFRTLS